MENFSSVARVVHNIPVPTGTLQGCEREKKERMCMGPSVWVQRVAQMGRKKKEREKEPRGREIVRVYAWRQLWGSWQRVPQAYGVSRRLLFRLELSGGIFELFYYYSKKIQYFSTMGSIECVSIDQITRFPRLNAHTIFCGIYCAVMGKHITEIIM